MVGFVMHISEKGLRKQCIISGWDMVEKWGNFRYWISRKKFCGETRGIKPDRECPCQQSSNHLEGKIVSHFCSCGMALYKNAVYMPLSMTLETLFMFW